MKSFEPWENFSPSPPKIISCLYIWSKHWASSCCCRKWHTPNLMVFWQQPLFQTQGKSNNHDDKKDSWLDGLRSLIFYYDTYGIYRGKFSYLLCWYIDANTIAWDGASFWQSSASRHPLDAHNPSDRGTADWEGPLTHPGSQWRWMNSLKNRKHLLSWLQNALKVRCIVLSIVELKVAFG